MYIKILAARGVYGVRHLERTAVLWRRRRVPGWVAGLSIGLFGIVFLQLGLGYKRRYWLHLPIGVGIFGGLMRQVDRLDTLRRTIGVRS